MFQLIRNRIMEKLRPSELVIENESHRHKARGEEESHFKVLVVSSAFEGLSTLQRHQLVNSTVMNGGPLPCHSLSIKALTVEAFRAKPEVMEEFKTPSCMGSAQ